jgi:tRNA(Leu) C34 or U34 (ribose-2'-O)-methylase TrmL
VFEGFDENNVPRIKRQVMFIGEYFGYFGAKYEAKTEVKETLEPIQALMTGNDVIFISKTDFAAGDKPLKLQNQLEAKHIIFDGSSAKQEIQEWLAEQQIKPYALHLEGAKPHHEVNWTEACAMVMGSEDRGLDSSWSAIDRVVIPMRGKVDSLNVSVAAAVVLYEGLRQRS